jgi:hypothetical protein
LATHNGNRACAQCQMIQGTGERTTAQSAFQNPRYSGPQQRAPIIAARGARARFAAAMTGQARGRARASRCLCWLGIIKGLAEGLCLIVGQYPAYVTTADHPWVECLSRPPFELDIRQGLDRVEAELQNRCSRDRDADRELCLRRLIHECVHNRGADAVVAHWWHDRVVYICPAEVFLP